MRGRRKPGKSRVVAVHVAGEHHAVVSLESRNRGQCSSVCAECPWRRDRPVGVFPAEAFRHSANTARDGAWEMFACHMAGRDNPTTCAGFLLRNSAHNLAARLARMTRPAAFTGLRETVPLYDSYRDMAIANGVAVDDPALEHCRADDE